MCKIEGCDRPSTALGLCSKHYMRVRRNGDANQTLRRGRKPDTIAMAVDARHVMSAHSPRTRAKYLKAMRLLKDVEDFCPEFEAGELARQTLAKAIRPNGSINVSALLDYANGEFVTRVLPNLFAGTSQ